MILITSDTHGDNDFRKLDNRSIKKEYDRLPDYVIITGDFGVPWSNNPKDAQDLYMIKWYAEKPYDIIIIPGNHENYSRIEMLPREMYHGGWARRLNKNIVFIEKNQVIEIEGKTFYCLGGADSTDKEHRILFQSWWPQEQATYADFISMMGLLDTVKEVDYILAHTAPSKIVQSMLRSDRANDTTSKLLDVLVENIKFKHFYFGHMHDDVTINGKYTCMYERVLEIK